MNRWYPTPEDTTPDRIRETLRIMLDQHYQLSDQVAKAKPAEEPRVKLAHGPLPQHGPADSMLCGLPIYPVDTQSLANGTHLTYVKKSGLFQFM